MGLELVKRHIAFAGVVGFLLAIPHSIIVYPIIGDAIVSTLVGVFVNFAVILALFKIYSRLSGAQSSWGPVIEAGLAQFLSFLFFSIAVYNLIPFR